MKAMYINAPGQVEFRDIDKPVRQKGEVLLKSWKWMRTMTRGCARE